MLEQSIPEGLYAIKKTRGKDSHWRSLLRTAAHVKDPYWRRSWRSVFRGWYHTLELEKSARSLLVEEKEAADITHGELTVTPISHPSAPPAGRRRRNGE